MRVLIAEGGIMERRFAEQAVGALGHEYVMAEDCAQAWALFRARGADVLLIDSHLPGMGGPELCRRVRAEGGAPYTYIILLGVPDDRLSRLVGMKAGADDCLAVPLQVDDLEASLTAAERVTDLHRRLAHREAGHTARLEQRDALLRLAGRIVAHGDAERMVAELLAEAVVLVGGDAGIVSRWDSDQRTLIPVRSTIPSPPGDGSAVALGYRATGHAAEQRAAVIVTDAAAAADGRRALAAPLLHEGRVLGAIAVISANPRPPFTTEDTELLAHLAAVGAAALVGLDRAHMTGAAQAMQALDPLRATGVDRRVRRNFPPQPTALIGRQGEQHELRMLVLGADARLVTLTGPPGVGKTRLALAVAAGVAGAFAHGVIFVDLAPLRDPALVMPTIARALSNLEPPAFEALQAALSQQHLLLVLDNFEQVAAAAPEVGQLLMACPSLTILVTSRSPLRLSWEREAVVQPLALPNLSGPLDLDTLGRTPAVALYVERARAVQPDFSLTQHNAATVAEMSLRLDGLPLAIELAAARGKVLPLNMLAGRMERSLGVLVGGPRDLPERHRSLRGAIAWSHALLGHDEQRLFHRLAVFAGGFTPEAAAAVCEKPGQTALSDTSPRTDTLEWLGALLHQSLVYRERGAAGEPRFALLHTIREYALERLLISGELETIQARHAAFFLTLAERAGARSLTHARENWLERLDQEHDNLRAALRRSADTGDVETELRLAGALARFWLLRGHVDEGCAWLGQALERSRSAPGPIRAKALLGAAALAAACADWVASEALCRASLDLFRELRDPGGAALALAHLALAQHRRGACAAARARARESLSIARKHADPAVIAHCLERLGEIAVDSGDLGAARTLYEESLTLALGVGDRGCVADVLEGLAVVAVALGRPRGGLRLGGAGAGLRADLGSPLTALAQARLDHSLDTARASLDEQVAAGAWTEGHSQAPERVAREAFQAEDGCTPGVHEVTDRADLGRLTRRERQVAALVARGLHNRQIGQDLGVTEHTAEVHVSSILGKLALTSRVRLAAWVVENRLADAGASAAISQPQLGG